MLCSIVSGGFGFDSSQVKKTPLPLPVAGFVCFFCCYFAFLHHGPALPAYENENNQAKEYYERIAH